MYRRLCVLGLLLTSVVGCDEGADAAGKAFTDLDAEEAEHDQQTLADCDAPEDALAAPEFCADLATRDGDLCSFCVHPSIADGTSHVVYEDEASCGALAGCGLPIGVAAMECQPATRDGACFL